MRSDLTDPAADAICAVRFSGSRTGYSYSESQYDIWDEADLAASLLGRGQLDLNFGWAGVMSTANGLDVPYLDETRVTVSFVPDAPSDFMPGEVAGTAYKTTATRTCDKTGGVNGPVATPVVLGSAKLDIQKRTGSIIEGVLRLTNDEEGGKLTFSAPIGPLASHDDTVCCLKNRYLQESAPEPPMTADEIAAACKARDAAPPAGTFEADAELGMNGYVDVTVDESLHDYVDAAGTHSYSSSFTLTFHTAYTKGTNPPSESHGWEGWSFSQSSKTFIAQPFGVGRHDGLDFSGWGGGSTCGDGFGASGSSTFGSDMKASLVITTHTDEIVEGTIELSNAPGKISRLHFKTQLHPPPQPSVCCLGQ
jgi:hypothetical protein